MLIKGSRRLVNIHYKVLCFVFEPWAISLGSTVQCQAADSHLQRTKVQTLGGIACIGLRLMEFCSTLNVLKVISLFHVASFSFFFWSFIYFYLTCIVEHRRREMK